MATPKIKKEKMNIYRSGKEALEAHFINMDTARTMVQNACNQEPVHFSIKAILELTKVKSVKALRIYKARTSDGSDTFILTAVNSYYEDIPLRKKRKSKKNARTSGGDEEGVLDMGQTCPSGYTNVAQRIVALKLLTGKVKPATAV